jgi:hypothetical protein
VQGNRLRDGPACVKIAPEAGANAGGKLSMNAKFRAKHPIRLALTLSVAMLLACVDANADDGNLTQQLEIQQQKSQFQLKLQQVQEQARQRAAAGQGASAGTSASPPANIDDATDSARLNPISVGDTPSIDVDPQRTQEFQAEQAYERDQQRILENRQQRSALLEGSRPDGPGGADDFANRRENLNRFKSQDRQQALQRKLRN